MVFIRQLALIRINAVIKKNTLDACVQYVVQSFRDSLHFSMSAAANDTIISSMKEETLTAVDFRKTVNRDHILGATEQCKLITHALTTDWANM